MNFIDIDNIITKSLINNIEHYEQFKTYYNILKVLNENNCVGGRLKRDINVDLLRLDDLKFSRNIFNLYKSKTKNLVKKYVSILKTPIQGNNIKLAESKKREIITEYFDILKTCVPHNILKNINISDNCNDILILLYCENCENTEHFTKDHDTTICNICYAELVKMTFYNNRMYNFSANKCNYDRISHFKECLKQYQGKQNTFINPVLYLDIEEALITNGIIGNREIPQMIRYKNVTRSHITYFLKELGYTKYYDDYILIHSNLTGQPANDISHLEADLISDFEKISEQYTILYNSSERKNFINIQYILYKLLLKHNYKFCHDDFSNIKSIDRKLERDKICKAIFKSLGWVYK